MTPDEWKRVSAIFESAVACDPQDRRRYVDEACDGDAALHAEVIALLTNDRADEFLEPENGHCAAAHQLCVDLPQLCAGLPTPHTAARSGERRRTEDPLIGRRVGRYEITRRIGEGGMGNVYLGVRTEDYTSQVAIKVVRRGMDSASVLSRFHDEMQFQAALGKHPNIARMVDAGETDEGLPYFVMEHVDGQRIDRWCDRHRLSLQRRLALFRDVCAAVQFAHQNTVLHRDLKPSNILVTDDGRPVLIDFGIAKLLVEASENVAKERTLTGMQVLTPEYASPEQVRGERLTTASDVYSLGVVLYELLTGKRPYNVDTRTPLQMAQIVSDVVPVKPSEAVARQAAVETSQPDTDTDVLEQLAFKRGTVSGRLRRALRGDLDRIVLMALRKEPERRYGSAEQLAADIDRYLEGLPVKAQRDTWSYRARKYAARNWPALAASAVVLAAIVGGGAFSIRSGAERSMKQTKPARQRARKPSPEKSRKLLKRKPNARLPKPRRQSIFWSRTSSTPPIPENKATRLRCSMRSRDRSIKSTRVLPTSPQRLRRCTSWPAAY